ncbi:MAG: NAD(P)H-binding protein [Chloroflexota bacterium]|nr:NAD(P)H-binding protein [Chloroflexota bacterium]
MRVLIFGASGNIGRHVREEARAAGHELVLFTRDPAGLEPVQAGETVVAGDIADPAAVERAVQGAEAVISVLGPTTNSADQVQLFEAFAKALVAAMKRSGARRLVTISGAGCTLPGEIKPVSGRVASAVVRLFVRHVVEAKQRELNVIVASDLDWTAPRPARVTDAPATGKYRVGRDAKGFQVSAADLAQFMVAQLADDSYLRQAPIVSN